MGAKQGKQASKKNNPAILTEEEINLLINNTHFNRKQIEEWHAGFIVSLNLKLNELIAN
jgi:hypothetical protein